MDEEELFVTEKEVWEFLVKNGREYLWGRHHKRIVRKIKELNWQWKKMLVAKDDEEVRELAAKMDNVMNSDAVCKIIRVVVAEKYEDELARAKEKRNGGAKHELR